MSRKETYEAKASELIAPVLEENGLELWDMEYVREGSDMILRAYIDKPEGVGINDCETVSRAFSDLLDKEDFIPDAYILEVSSPGIDRILKKDWHLARYTGEDVDVHTFKPVNGERSFVGTLTAFDENTLKITADDGDEIKFDRKNIARIRLYVAW